MIGMWNSKLMRETLPARGWYCPIGWDLDGKKRQKKEKAIYNRA